MGNAWCGWNIHSGSGKIAVRKNNANEIVDELKIKIPVHYIVQIKEKVENIDAQTEVIMFTEDLRNDIN